MERPYNPDTHHSHDHMLLRQELLALSSAQEWDVAKLEWTFVEAYEDEPWANCLCGHGIKERCILQNQTTGAREVVGNCCVKRFLPEAIEGEPTDAMFASIKRVRKSPNKALHARVIVKAKEQRKITPWAAEWYSRSCQKRELTVNQFAYRRRVNRRALAPPQGLPSPSAEERFCMPHDGPWRLDEAVIEEARVAGRLTDWEAGFYKEHYGVDRVPVPHAPIKRRIEELTLPNPWHLERKDLDEAKCNGRITRWEHDFYLTSAAESKGFSHRQALLKWRIEAQVGAFKEEVLAATR